MNKQVEEYISKQEKSKAEIIQALRKILLKTLPELNEAMKWGVICYNDLYYLVSLREYVNFGFSIIGLSKEEAKSFEGSGKTMKHLSIKSIKDIDESKIVKLIKLVKAKCKPVHK